MIIVSKSPEKTQKKLNGLRSLLLGGEGPSLGKKGRPEGLKVTFNVGFGEDSDSDEDDLVIGMPVKSKRKQRSFEDKKETGKQRDELTLLVDDSAKKRKSFIYCVKEELRYGSRGRQLLMPLNGLQLIILLLFVLQIWINFLICLHIDQSNR